MKNKLMIIVPCYCEEEVLPTTAERLLAYLKGLIEKGKVGQDSGILFVNDGSTDRTWELIRELHTRDGHFYGLSLSANAGHQNALLAGMEKACERWDMAITIDADLQDDIEVIEEMVDAYRSGADIVYGVRSSRKTDTFFKRTTAQGFYKFMSRMGVKTVYNHSDFRLMSRRAMLALSEYKERNMFLRGIVPKLGFKTAIVTYERKKREAGESKYPLGKMLAFAWDGITSLSIRPISMIMGLGLLMVLLSFIALIYILVSFFMGRATLGWPSLMVSVWFLGGLQLFSIGVVGQYVGKTYIESKERPRYFIEESLDHQEKE